jgi:prepilin-type N-terminal cleavage/methylation domain-containing protein
MPKVVAAPMPILKTGNRSAGYTLLEIVAVITLIGLILTLVYPRLDLSAERLEAGYIGRLIQADFKRLKAESIIDPSSDFAVTFKPNGYSLFIGEHHITRSFKYHFTFELPEEPLQSEEGEGKGGSLSSAVNQNAPQPVKPETSHDTDGTAPEPVADTTETSCEVHIVRGEIHGEELQLLWQTSHFKGSFLCKKDGSVEWKYEKK